MPDGPIERCGPSTPRVPWPPGPARQRPLDRHPGFHVAATGGVGAGKRVEPESLRLAFATLLVALAIGTGVRALLAIF